MPGVVMEATDMDMAHIVVSVQPLLHGSKGKGLHVAARARWHTLFVATTMYGDLQFQSQLPSNQHDIYSVACPQQLIRRGICNCDAGCMLMTGAAVSCTFLQDRAVCLNCVCRKLLFTL